jgi:hypothetical protein
MTYLWLHLSRTWMDGRAKEEDGSDSYEGSLIKSKLQGIRAIKAPFIT